MTARANLSDFLGFRQMKLQTELGNYLVLKHIDLIAQ